MTIYKRLLVAASFGLALPAVSFADVFSCPSKPLITITKVWPCYSYMEYWEARLEELPHGMPTIFKGARFISDGIECRNNHSLDNIIPINPGMGMNRPLKIQFVGASYDDSSGLKYECFYKAKGFFLGLPVSLRLSGNYLPGSNKMPLLVKPHGSNWEKAGVEKSLRKCTGTAEECSFYVPQYAVRTTIETPPPSEGSIQEAFSLYLDTEKIVEENLVRKESNEVIPTTDKIRHIFSAGPHFRSFNSTNIKLYDQRTPVNINDFIKARAGEPKTAGEDECAVNSGVTVKCSCSQSNLVSSLNSNGYTMVDMFAAYNETYGVAEARCSLFNVPAFAKEH